jgi:hypothetical protein
MELTNMSTAISFEGSGGGGGGTFIEKTITVNDTYNAADDGADGYSKVTVNVGNVMPLYAYQNGWWDAYDYDVDAFSVVYVDVQPQYEFCERAKYNDIASIVALASNEYIYDDSVSWDESENFGVQWAIEENGTELNLYKISYDGTKELIDTNSGGTTYIDSYMTVEDATTGSIKLHYKTASQPSVWQYYSKTLSDIEGYGDEWHILKIKKLVAQ